MPTRLPAADESLTDLIFGWSDRTPDKAAIVVDGVPHSYRAFATAIAQARGYFAHRHLAGAGVAVVAVRSLLGFWVASLALRSLGLTTIAVHTADALAALPLPELRCVVVGAGDGGGFGGLDAFCAERGVPLVALAGEAPLDVGDSRPADGPGGHILLTSATTGRQKMVLLEPSFEAGFLLARLDVSGMTQDSIVNLFDFGGWTGGGYKSSALAWMIGATVVVDQRRPRELALNHPGITLSLMVPTMLDEVLAAPEGAFPRSETMWLSVTGGSLTQAQIDAAKARITPHLFSGLGATETVSFGFTPLHTPDDQRWHRIVPGVVVQVVDPEGRSAAVGEIGEVRVSSAGGPTGYLNDEVASRTFFRDGFFYPGDLAIVRADGRMALQGRVTAVINVRGHKISPEPFEHNLREGLGVRDVCLFSMPDERGEEQIHVIVETPAPIATARLVQVLSPVLQGFPQAQVHFTPALPRNEMGKVLRQAARERALAALNRG